MWPDAGPQPRALARQDARFPEDLRRDGRVGAPARDGPREEPGLGPHPAVVHTQRRQHGRTPRDVAIASALAPLNVNQHAPAVDVFDLHADLTPKCLLTGGRRIVLPFHRVLDQCAHQPGTLGEFLSVLATSGDGRSGSEDPHHPENGAKSARLPEFQMVLDLLEWPVLLAVIDGAPISLRTAELEATGTLRRGYSPIPRHPFR